jgi:hypothetical protein
VVANNSQQTWKYGRYLYILAITNKKITFRRTLRLWSKTFIDRKIPINKLNSKWTVSKKVDGGLCSATVTQRVNVHFKAQQTIGGGKNTMRNQPGSIPNRSYETRHFLIPWRGGAFAPLGPFLCPTTEGKNWPIAPKPGL